MLTQIRNSLNRFNKSWTNINNRSPYWALDDGVMFNRQHHEIMKRRGAEIGIKLTLRSSLFYSDAQRLAIWDGLRTVLQQGIPEGCRGRMIVQCIRANPRASQGYGEQLNSANSLINTLVDGKRQSIESRRLRGDVREWHFYFTCTVKGKNRKRDEPLPQEDYDEILRNAVALRRDLAQKFELIGFTAKEMNSQDVLRLCRQYWNPDLVTIDMDDYVAPDDQEGIYPIEIMQEFDQLNVSTTRAQIHMSESMNKHPRYLLLGQKFIKVAVVTKAPKRTFLGSLDELLSSMDQGSCYVMLDFEHEPYYNVLRKYNAKFQRLDNTLAQKDTMPLAVDSSTKQNHKETEYALERLEQGEHSFKCGIAVVMIGDTAEQAEHLYERCKGGFSRMKLQNFVVKNLGNSKHFQALAPFAGSNNGQMFTLLEANGAELLPISGPWEGNDEALHLFDNRWGTLTRINPFNSGLTNYNGLIVAGSGTGKTQLAQSLLKDHAAAGSQIVVIDKGYGYGPFMELAEAAILKIEPGVNTTINPFDLRPGMDSPDDDQKAFLLSMIRCIIPTRGTARDKIENNIILSCITRVYKKAREEVFDPETKQTRIQFKTPRMSDFVKALETMSEINGRSATDEEKHIAQELVAQLEPFTGNNTYGAFIDRDTNVNIESNLLYFDVTNLERYKDLTAVGILLISKLLYNKFMANPGTKKIAVIDEAWAMLKIPEAQEFIVDLYRRARHMGGAIYCISQKLTDFLAIPGIVENASLFFLSKLKGDEENKAIQNALKMPDAAMRIYQNLKVVPRKYSEFLVWEAAGNESQGDVIRVILSPVEYWTFTTNNDDKAKRNKYVQQYGSLSRAIEKLAGIN